MVAKNRTDSQISQSLARKLNRMLFALKGAKGTLAMPWHWTDGGSITNEQALHLRGLNEHTVVIQRVLDHQIALIENYYIAYGSTTTRERRLDKRQLEKRRKAGEILSDEEYDRLFFSSTGKSYKKPKEAPSSPLRDFLPGS